jgi:hypothetical protein
MIPIVTDAVTPVSNDRLSNMQRVFRRHGKEGKPKPALFSSSFQ